MSLLSGEISSHLHSKAFRKILWKKPSWKALLLVIKKWESAFRTGSKRGGKCFNLQPNLQMLVRKTGMTDLILKTIHSGLLTVTCCSQFSSPGLANTFCGVSSNIKGSSVYAESLRLIFLSDCNSNLLNLCSETVPVLYYNTHSKSLEVVFWCFPEQEPFEAILCLAEVLRFSLKLFHPLYKESSNMSNTRTSFAFFIRMT